MHIQKKISAVLLFCLLSFSVGGKPAIERTGASEEANAGDSTHKHYVPVSFFAVTNDAINKAIAKIYQTEITIIAYPNQGDLMWNYQNLNGVFNKGTYDYVSARVFSDYPPGLAELTGSGGFPNSWSQVLSSLYYYTSNDENQRVQSAVNSAAMEALSIVGNYEYAFGTITQADIDSAKAKYGDWISAKQDVIIHAIAGANWSGREKAGLPPLSYTEMKSAADLSALLPDMPSQGSAVIKSMVSYLSKINKVSPILDSSANGSWTINQLKNNTWKPSEGNSGMRTVDPNTGAVQCCQIGYSISNPVFNISDELHDPDRTITIFMHILKTGETDMAVYVSTVAGVVDSIIYTLPDSVYVNLYPLPNNKAEQLIELDYVGFTMMDVQPYNWNESTGKGWYFAWPVNEAIANDSQDISGYKFTSWPKYNMGPFSAGGDFGIISRLLICDYQKLSISMGNTQTNHDNIRPALHRTQGTGPVIPVPSLQQTAYVIGGVFGFPLPPAETNFRRASGVHRSGSRK